MTRRPSICLFRRECLASIVVFVFLALFHVPTFTAKQSYIVYMGSHPHGRDASPEVLERATQSHHEFLGSFLGSQKKAKEAIFYSYNKHINGFAAHLEEEEAAEIAKHPDVISVFPNRVSKLHTTYSWRFMGLENKNGQINPDSAWNMGNFGADIIVANIDNGVWPESMSFSDNGYGPVPARWSGYCQYGVSCNRKLNGAKYFKEGLEAKQGPTDPQMVTPRDQVGHGTHTLSTAAGNFVPGASVLGVDMGTAKGGAPWARVASYKAFWPFAESSLCYDADALAAFEEAIYDGVNVLSISGGPMDSIAYFNDAFSIGAFHAVKHGIVVVCSAGNSSPDLGTVINVSPWILTVGAGTLDREFVAAVELETMNCDMYFKGQSLSKPLPEKKFYPLITSAQARAAFVSLMTRSLDPELVEGTILVCVTGEISRIQKGQVAAQAGAVGMILCNDYDSGNLLVAEPHVLPTTHISYEDGTSIFAYIKLRRYPRAYITKPTAKMGDLRAPMVAGFSSRGPNPANAEILKPDIIAPGEQIIAAFTGATTITGLPFDNRLVEFNVLSGTSMSCPHVAGIAAAIRWHYPDWSPAAIKSALMTTANPLDTTGNLILDESTQYQATPFHYGAGHMLPNRAIDPGLVYDMNNEDYLNFLCAAGYNEESVQRFSNSPYWCPNDFSIFDLNLPSISVPDLSHGPVTLSRKLKNVGSPGTYVLNIEAPLGVYVSIEPATLIFYRAGDEIEFKVTLQPLPDAGSGCSFGLIEWTDGIHSVRTPIAIGFP